MNLILIKRRTKLTGTLMNMQMLGMKIFQVHLTQFVDVWIILDWRNFVEYSIFHDDSSFGKQNSSYAILQGSLKCQSSKSLIGDGSIQNSSSLKRKNQKFSYTYQFEWYKFPIKHRFLNWILYFPRPIGFFEFEWRFFVRFDSFVQVDIHPFEGDSGNELVFPTSR